MSFFGASCMSDYNGWTEDIRNFWSKIRNNQWKGLIVNHSNLHGASSLSILSDTTPTSELWYLFAAEAEVASELPTIGQRILFYDVLPPADEIFQTVIWIDRREGGTFSIRSPLMKTITAFSRTYIHEGGSWDQRTHDLASLFGHLFYALTGNVRWCHRQN